MNGLRTYYNVQKRKVESSENSGTGTDTVHKPKWQFFETLEFLRDNVTPRRTYSNIDEGDELLSTNYSSGRSHGKKSAEGPSLSGSDSFLATATNALNNIATARATPPPPAPPSSLKTMDEHFGETAGKLMSEIPDGINKDMLRLNIQKMIVEVKHNIQHENAAGLHYTTSPPPQSFNRGNSDIGSPTYLQTLH